ncbi:MAG: thiazole synthase [Deltaproteobacteria bacterium]|nr:MAG: thiazole synthase [Deltaproteobacteria bacterium]
MSRDPIAALQTEDPWTLAGRTLSSRLIVGTGKYRSKEETIAALDASGAEIVTVALRRVDFDNPENVLAWIDRERYTLLPNTAGCYTAEEAVRVCRLARELGIDQMVKLEVIGDAKTLLPDNEQTLEAARILLDEGFTVLPYCSDDPVVCRKLEEMGCAAVMPLAAPIGSGLGIQNPHKIALIVEQSSVPVIVDAGVGTASDAAIALELGCTAVLMNTAIAEARDPVKMARAMRLGVVAGRLAYTAGRMPRRGIASASSPESGRIE